MRKLTPSAVSRFFVIAAFLAAAAIASISCGQFLGYQDICIAKSPNQRREVRVSERACSADCIVRVTAVSDRGAVNLGVKTDSYVGFVEAAWSPDSRIVGVFVYLTFKQGILVGYDFEEQKILPPQRIRPQIEATIRARYSLSSDFLLPYSGDLDEWSAQSGRWKFDIRSAIKSRKPVILPFQPVPSNQG